MKRPSDHRGKGCLDSTENSSFSLLVSALHRRIREPLEVWADEDKPVIETAGLAHLIPSEEQLLQRSQARCRQSDQILATGDSVEGQVERLERGTRRKRQGRQLGDPVVLQVQI
jgi:hypothetical protein